VSEGQASEEPPAPVRVPLTTIAREWTRIGCTGFGGPPAHVALLRKMCVDQRRWLDAREFEDGIAATNLLPGPASTQMAIFCGWRLRGASGAVLGGLCFIVPGLILILLLAAVFLAHHPPTPITGAAAGAGAAVPAVALRAAAGLVPSSWERAAARSGGRWRWVLYVLAGGAGAAALGSALVLVLLGCGLIEIALHHGRGKAAYPSVIPAAAAHGLVVGGLGALAFVAIKVGALSYGGGFVIVPLMQHDAVSTYHFMTAQQFLSAVALGQITPGPVVQTVAVVGYAARGVGGGLVAAAIAFTPSFLFVLLGAPHFDRVRHNAVFQSFLTGAGPAAVGAIAGAAIPLGLASQFPWQVAVLAAALLALFPLRRGVVATLLAAAGIGVLLALSGVAV
jgi:chromate transporter